MLVKKQKGATIFDAALMWLKRNEYYQSLEILTRD